MMADPKSEDDSKSNKRSHADFTGDDGAGKPAAPQCPARLRGHPPPELTLDSPS